MTACTRCETLAAADLAGVFHETITERLLLIRAELYRDCDVCREPLEELP